MTVTDLPTNGPAIAESMQNRGFRCVPLSAPILGNRKSGKSPDHNGKGWWNRAGHYHEHTYQGCNVGVACGYPLPDNQGYLLVVDPDGEAGVNQLVELASKNGGLPDTFTVASGSGVGAHLYFAASRPLGARKLDKNIDTRSVGGQVVAPGCRHYTGGTYEILSDVPIAPAPAWLEALLSPIADSSHKSPNAYTGPEIALTRDMVKRRAAEMGPAHGSYAALQALALGKTWSEPGRYHEQVDLWLMTTLVGEFTPGISAESVLALCSSLYGPAWTPKNRASLLDGLRTAKAKWRPELSVDELKGLGPDTKRLHIEPAVNVHPRTSLSRLNYSDPPEIEHVAEVVDPPIDLLPTHAQQALNRLGRRTANGAAEAREIWSALAGVHVGSILPSQVPAVLSLVLKAFPTATAASIEGLIAPVLSAPVDLSQALAQARAPLPLYAKAAEKQAMYERARVTISDETGSPHPLQMNAIKIIRAALGPDLRVNVRGRVLECRLMPWDREQATWRPWKDADDTALVSWIGEEHQIHSFSSSTLHPFAASAGEASPADPWREYLESLPPWDGEDRLSIWLQVIAGAEDTAYTRSVGAKFLVSIIARTFVPGCKVDTKLILISPQGGKKTSLFETLVGPEFYSGSGKMEGEPMRDFIQRLHRFVIHEDAELQSFRASDIEAEKAFMTCRFDTFRPPYGHTPGTFPRMFVQVGSSNHAEILHDVTGGRRFWPVTVQPVDLPQLREVKDMLWAEALHRYQAGETWWLEGEEEAEARAVQEAHRAKDEIEEQIRTILDAPTKLHLNGFDETRVANGQITAVTVTEILGWLDSERKGLVTKGDQMRISGALRALGWVKVQIRKGTSVIKVWARP